MGHRCLATAQAKLHPSQIIHSCTPWSHSTQNRGGKAEPKRSTTIDLPKVTKGCRFKLGGQGRNHNGCGTHVRSPPPTPPGCPAYVQPLSPCRQMPASVAFVTDNNRPQPLWQPPPTACPTASGATSEACFLRMHPCSDHTLNMRWGRGVFHEGGMDDNPLATAAIAHAVCALCQMHISASPASHPTGPPPLRLPP